MESKNCKTVSVGLLRGLRDRFTSGGYFDAVVLLAGSYRAVERSKISEILLASGVSGKHLKIQDQPARAGTLVICSHPEFHLEVLSVDAPYVPGGFTMEHVVERIGDHAIASAFVRHGAFITCNSGNGCPERLRSGTGRIISAVAAALRDQWTLLLWDAPSNRMIFPSEDALSLLSPGDRRSAFELVTWSPTVGVGRLDLIAEMEEARRRWPEFVAEFRGAADKSRFAVKCSFDKDDGQGTEHIWVVATSVEDDRVSGLVLNKPNNVSWLQRGANVGVELANISDWIYFEDGNTVGGFTDAKIRAAGEVHGPE